ncbi:MAG: indolepyruvate oxidoreductase subunit beta [Deltaproteobacteria bacterium]|nr:indolepyruvate oxidoreductase subunit beta [Deltaproteobacteria bacterium]
MESQALRAEPFNLIIAGVGGQGNVLASRVVGSMLSQKGYTVTIGETFGGTQRGGSVMSHLRISSHRSYSPVIPKAKAHLIVALEPIEAVRLLKDFGNPDVRILCNMRPIHPVQVISGELQYPSLDDVRSWVTELTGQAWFVNATDLALELGARILGNIIMLGALAGTGVLPLERTALESYLSTQLPAGKLPANLAAYDRGMALVWGSAPPVNLPRPTGAKI